MVPRAIVAGTWAESRGKQKFDAPQNGSSTGGETGCETWAVLGLVEEN